MLSVTTLIFTHFYNHQATGRLFNYSHIQHKNYEIVMYVFTIQVMGSYNSKIMNHLRTTKQTSETIQAVGLQIHLKALSEKSVKQFWTILVKVSVINLCQPMAQ